MDVSTTIKRIDTLIRTRKGVKILDSLGVVLDVASPFSLGFFASGASSSARIMEGILSPARRNTSPESTGKICEVITALQRLAMVVGFLWYFL
jgi:hypothetical protein